MSRGAKKWVRRLGAGAGVLALALLVWGVGIEPRWLDVAEARAVIPGLPVGWEGARVAALSDFQLGMWLDNEETVAKAVAAAVAARPALVLLLGDYIYAREGEPEEKARRARELLAPLVRAGIPTFAVLGNHDYGQDDRDDPPDEERAATVEREMEASGIRVLQNEAAAVARPGTEPLWVVAIGPAWAGRSHPAAAIGSVPERSPRVVLMHNPESFAAIGAGEAPFAVAGHTHGGQVRLPFLTRWSWLTLVKSTRAVDGWAPPSYGEARNRLYVNRGIGFSALPVRINCRPELTVFTLTAQGSPESDPPSAASAR